jgi:hypothetical protein
MAEYQMKIYADKAGLIKYLGEIQAGHQGAAKTAGTKDEKARQAGIAEGIGKAIEALQAWEELAGGERIVSAEELLKQGDGEHAWQPSS